MFWSPKRTEKGQPAAAGRSAEAWEIINNKLNKHKHELYVLESQKCQKGPASGGGNNKSNKLNKHKHKIYVSAQKTM